MSLNKIIIGFIVILLLFSCIVLYQINKAPIPKSTVTIDNHTFSVAVATTSAQQQQGLSERASLPKDQGMLFVFNKPNHYAFWMKGMQFSLDLIFLNNKKIVAIFPNIPAPTNKNSTNLPVYTPDSPADQTLEINAGIAKAYGFKKGDTVKETLK